MNDSPEVNALRQVRTVGRRRVSSFFSHVITSLNMELDAVPCNAKLVIEPYSYIPYESKAPECHVVLVFPQYYTGAEGKYGTVYHFVRRQVTSILLGEEWDNPSHDLILREINMLRERLMGLLISLSYWIHDSNVPYKSREDSVADY